MAQKTAEIATALSNKHKISLKSAYQLTDTMFKEVKITLAQLVSEEHETWKILSIEEKEMVCNQMAKALLDDYGVTEFLSNKQ